MDEAGDSSLLRGGEHCAGADDIARLEPRGVGGIDHPGDVDHRIGAVDQRTEAVGPVERAIDPGDPVASHLGAAGEGADLVTARQRRIKQARADEAGAAGDRQL